MFLVYNYCDRNQAAAAEGHRWARGCTLHSHRSHPTALITSCKEDGRAGTTGAQTYTPDSRLLTAVLQSLPHCAHRGWCTEAGPAATGNRLPLLSSGQEEWQGTGPRLLHSAPGRWSCREQACSSPNSAPGRCRHHLLDAGAQPPRWSSEGEHHWQ